MIIALLIISIGVNLYLFAIGRSHYDEKQDIINEAIRRGYGERKHRRFVWFKKKEVR